MNPQQKKTKLTPLSKLIDTSDIDTVKWSQLNDERRAMEILFRAQNCWDNMARYRKERERCKNYNYGNQWEDVICKDGKMMTEADYISLWGVPLKNNLIRRLVRNVIGVFRSQDKEPTCTARDRDEQKLGETMSTILQCNWQQNRMSEINARSFEDFLIGGMVIHKKTFGWRNDRMDCWTDYVNPNNWFVDTAMRDFRGWDVSLVGEIHDVSFEDLCHEFAHCVEDYTRLAEIYKTAHNLRAVSVNAEQFGHVRLSSYDFLCPTDPSICRVIEVWSKESKPRYRCHDYQNGDYYKIEEEDYDEMVTAVNKQRIQTGLTAGMPKEEIPLIQAEWFMDTYWYYRFLTPLGQVLQEGETPYEHKGHPYCFKIYPYIDGEVHSFVADVIDQQRYVNRLITMYDWIMRASAKGVLLVPKDSVKDIGDRKKLEGNWAKFNGVIYYTPGKSGQIPQQIANNSTNIGIGELLNLQLKFFEDISGVNGALQGKPGYAGTSGNKYAQETQNATTSLLDLLETYSTFVIDCAYKDVKNMQQFYDSKRVFNIAGKSGAEIVYDPKKIRDVEFDLSIQESQNTPAYRDVMNEYLINWVNAGLVPLQTALEVGDFKFSDELLQKLKSQQQDLQNGKTPEELSPQLQQQVAAAGNPQAVQQMQGAAQQQGQ